ncbi:hypothetical protein HDU99_004591 [Rhizoclosmatium hyalinum]|nr:hypothetical protein HDU99_004591 [Rhizoclosmatium hyalinum]
MSNVLAGNFNVIQSFISVFPFALAGFAITFFIVILEVPFATKWCPTGPRMQKMAQFFTNPIFRTLLYAGMSAVMWLSILMASTLILIPAISLSVTTLAYAVAMFKMDPPATPLAEPNLGKLAAKAAVTQKSSAV